MNDIPYVDKRNLAFWRGGAGPAPRCGYWTGLITKLGWMRSPFLSGDTPPKLNSSPLKSYRNSIGKANVSQPPFFRGKFAVKLRGCISFWFFPFSCEFSPGCVYIYIPGTQTTIKKWMFGETTISYVKIGNHPIETTIYKWLFRVPGICFFFFKFFKNHLGFITPICLGNFKLNDHFFGPQRSTRTENQKSKA